MSLSCPISIQRIDANLVRIISWQVLLFSLLFLVTQEMILALIVLFDFLVRALRFNRISPFYLFASLCLTFQKKTPQMCDESPKRFALYLGLAVSLLINLCYLVPMTNLALTIAVVLSLCAFFEAAFEFCIGCKLYYMIEFTKE